jgi:hypothetical protein
LEGALVAAPGRAREDVDPVPCGLQGAGQALDVLLDSTDALGWEAVGHEQNAQRNKRHASILPSKALD